MISRPDCGESEPSQPELDENGAIDENRSYEDLLPETVEMALAGGL